MTRPKTPLTIIKLGLFVVVCLVFGISSAAAADSDRGERWQFHIPITSVSSEEFDGQGESSVDLSSDVGFGFALGYNFDEQWFLGFEATFMEMGYEARIPFDADMDNDADGVVTIGGNLDSTNLQFSGQFNILKKSITPFIRGSLGATHVDTNIPSGPAQGVCWWHPWWGYICNAWQPTHDETSFSYGAGIGIRGDLTERLFFEASANKLWVDFDDTDTPSFTGIRLSFGWLF